MIESGLMGGITRLEAISAAFDYSRKEQYVGLAKQFIRGMREFESGTPFFNVCGGLGVVLPQAASDRLEAILRARPHYAPTTQRICHWYLLELHAMDLNLKPAGSSVYEPLIQMLELGGDFYEHHGDLCLRDAAMVILRGR
jgi:hypothetical protein